MTSIAAVPAELLGPQTDYMPRRRYLADFLEAHPGHHNQSWWLLDDRLDERRIPLAEMRENICDTDGCAAGWTVVLFGDPDWEVDTNSVYFSSSCYSLGKQIREAAAVLLDLTPDERLVIFAADTTRADVLAGLRGQEAAADSSG